MKIEQILTGLALAGGAYWWYTRDAGPAPNPTGTTPIASATPPGTSTNAAGATVTTGTNNPPAGGGNPATPPPAPPPAGYATLDPVGGVPNFSQWVANKLGPGRHLLGADAWNALFSQFSGVQQTADLFTPDNRGEEISLTTYIGRRAAAGLSGLNGVGVGGVAFGLPIAAARQLAGAGFRAAGAYALRGDHRNTTRPNNPKVGWA